MANLLEKIEGALLIEQDLQRCAELSARRAIYLSRIGRFAEVKEIIENLRLQYSDGHAPAISVWIMLIEGVNDFFENLGDRAKDRITRAQLIGVAIGDRTLAAITSSWRAHIEFEVSDFESMATALKICAENLDEENHDANARFAMIIANCFFLRGDRESAQKWFMKSREIALANGDQATIDALIYNRAAFGMARLRVERCLGPVNQQAVISIRVELSSARNYQKIARVGAVNHFVELCLARVLMLEEKFDSALEALARIKTIGPFAAYNFSLALIDLESAYCLCKLGRYAEANESLESAFGDVFSGLDVDDRLVVAWLFAEIRNEKAGLIKFGHLEIDFQAVSDEYTLMHENLGNLVSAVVSDIS